MTGPKLDTFSAVLSAVLAYTDKMYPGEVFTDRDLKRLLIELQASVEKTISVTQDPHHDRG